MDRGLSGSVKGQRCQVPTGAGVEQGRQPRDGDGTDKLDKPKKPKKKKKKA